MSRIFRLTDDQVARFWSHVQMGYDHECWPWQAYTNKDGYGQWSVTIEGKKVTFYTHRLAYALFHGPIPDDLEAAHSINCETRACCNPDHLTPKSHWDNLRDIPSRRAKALGIDYYEQAQL